MGSVFVNLENSGQAIMMNLNTFDRLLGNNERFVLASNQRNVNCTFFKDSAHRALMVMTYCPGETIRVRECSGYNTDTHTSHYRTVFRTKDEVKMHDASGLLLLTASGYRRAMTSITCGEPLMTIFCNMQTLGTLSGNSFFSNRLTAKGFMGESLFYSQKGGQRCCSCCTCGYTTTATEFTLHSMNGLLLARIEKYGVPAIHNTRNIDLRTKVILIFAAYYLYHEYFAESKYGATGYRGENKREYILIVVFIIGSMCLLLFVLFYFTLWHYRE